LLSAYDGIDNVLLRPHEPILASSWIWFGVFDVALPIYAWLLIRTLRERNALLLELQQLSITDPLTGALNRRGFLDRAAASIAQGHRANQSMVLIVLDLDHFKAVNDAYGHDAGDALLKTIVQAVSQELREGDLLGRLGGDEFALLIVNNELLAAADVVKRSLARAKDAIRQLRGGLRSTSVRAWLP
jgi:diguanylate cyclase (GGDEF)-like protein